MYNLIVAICKKNGIGCCGKMPWKIKEDLAMFSRLTRGDGNNAIIMGRKTWNSLNDSPLPGRMNIVLSRTLNDDNNSTLKNTLFFNTFESIINHCTNEKYDEVWIIGGETIYKYFMERHLVNKCYITHIDFEYNCDTFFPDRMKDWKLETSSSIQTSNNYSVKMNVYNPK